MWSDRVVVLVNGLPGAGKTTLARPLAAALGLPLFGKDDVKETLASVLGSAPPERDQRAWSQLLGAAAMEAIWTLLADAPGGGVVEANLLAPTRPHATAGLARAGVRVDETVEVWCDVPAEVARERFEARAPARHGIHGAQVGLDAQWAQWIGQARPPGLGRVIRVDTTGPVDHDLLAATIWRARRADRGAILGDQGPKRETRDRRRSGCV